MLSLTANGTPKSGIVRRSAAASLQRAARASSEATWLSMPARSTRVIHTPGALSFSRRRCKARSGSRGDASRPDAAIQSSIVSSVGSAMQRSGAPWYTDACTARNVPAFSAGRAPSLVGERAIGPVAQAGDRHDPDNGEGSPCPPGQASPPLQRRREPAAQANLGAVEELGAVDRSLRNEGEADQDHDLARDDRNRIRRDADGDDDKAAEVERDVHSLGVPRSLALAVEALEALARRRSLELVQGLLGRAGHGVARARAPARQGIRRARSRSDAPAPPRCRPFVAILAAP